MPTTLPPPPLPRFVLVHIVVLRVRLWQIRRRLRRLGVDHPLL